MKSIGTYNSHGTGTSPLFHLVYAMSNITKAERFTLAWVWMKSASCRVVICFWLYTARSQGAWHGVTTGAGTV